MRKRQAFLLVIVPMLGAEASAAEILNLPEVTVRGDRPPYSSLPQQATILHRDQLLRSGAQNLAQLLKTQTSFAVRQYGPIGSLATASLRGSLGEGVLVLRDGVKLNSPERGGVDLSTVSLLGVDRVEILTGGASALYGAEAVGGVINLITAKRPHQRVEAGLGHFGQRYLKAESGATWGDSAFTIGLNRLYAENGYPFAYRHQLQPRRNAQLDGTDVVLSGKTRFGNTFLDLGLNATEQLKGVPGPVNYPSPLASQQDRVLVGSARWFQPWGDFAQTTAFSHHHAALRFTDPRSIYQKAGQSTLNSTDLQTALEWGDGGRAFTAGIGMTRDAVSGQNFGAKERYLGTLFAHDEWAVGDRLTLSSGLRLDYNSTFGFNPSPGLGASFQVDPHSRWRARIGRAYRAPTFNDLYWPSAVGAAGNAGLLPETSTQLELGWDAQRGPIIWEGTLFWHRGTNSIVWNPGIAGVWSPINAGTTDIRGLELKGTYAQGPFRWVNSATGLSALDLSGRVDKTLLYRPDWVAHSALSYAFTPSFGVTLGWDYLGKRYTTAQNTEFLPPVGLWSVSASYALTGQDRLSLHIDNLTAKDYELQPYYPMPGRQVVASWSHEF